MNNIQSLPLVNGPVTFEGAVSLEVTPQYVHPWRLIHEDFELFEPALRNLPAATPAGIRLTMVSNTTTITLQADAGQPEKIGSFDLLVDGKLHQRQPFDSPYDTITFTDIPQGEHVLELYLPQRCPVRIKSIAIDANATATPYIDTRPKWLVYGSSITHCGSANGPTETWPALVASRFNLNLTCLGYGGSCHMEPMVTRMMRDLPADYISVCLGINMYGGSTYNQRTFRAGVIGTLLNIRDGHPDTPLVVVSPISNPPREDKPNLVGMTLTIIRQAVEEVVTLLQARGDKHIHFVDGLKLYGPEYAHHMPDGLHPDAKGTHVLADRYCEVAMPPFNLKDHQATTV